MKMAVDLSSVINTCLLGGKDIEGEEVEFEGKKVLVNSAAYGYEPTLNMMVAALKQFRLAPKDMILVVEGMNSKFPRLMIDKGYKLKKQDRPMESYVEFQKLRDQIVELFRSLGAIACVQDNCEADDVLGWLAENMREDTVILTRDNDIAVVNGVNKHGANIQVCIKGEVGYNKYGLFDCKYISLYKAMVGDDGDKITGIKGFGEAAWLAFDVEFGEEGMKEMIRLGELGSLEDLALEATQNKMVGKIYAGRVDFIKSYRLAKLHPEWVNHWKDPIKWLPGFTHGRVKDERLEQWCAKRWLVTADKWDTFVPWALAELAKTDTYALDIETSTPVESDDWLLAMGKEDGVDVIGSKLTGMSLTFGVNMHLTVYISIDHADTKNVTVAQLVAFIKQIKSQPVIHNTMFEGPVLYQEFGEELKDNGWEGFLPNWLDTKLEASYVDENSRLGLKSLSKQWLGYDQVDYVTVTTLEGPAGPATEVDGVWSYARNIQRGRFVTNFEKELSPATVETIQTLDEEGNPTGESTLKVTVKAVTEVWERVRLKMNELTAREAFDYACDDTITTTGLHNFFKLFMELEGTWEVYKQVEIGASYLHAQSFVHGTKISLSKIQELMIEDDAVFNTSKQALDTYLISKGWEGTVCPQYTEVTAAAFKEAYHIIYGDEFKTAIRTLSKLVDMVIISKPTFAAACGDVEKLNALVRQHFNAAPVFNAGSPKQMQSLLYETMALPVRVYNKPTDNMKKAGLKIGTPKSDGLAIAYALMECTPEQEQALKAVRLMKMVETRRGLYYKPYPDFCHWRTGKIHASHNQAATNTRRASMSAPNLQQVSKTEKVEGYSPRVREIFIPHKKRAVIVSMDFMSQELRVIADYSKDRNMVACFVGDNLKDMHALTGLDIARKKQSEHNWTYEEFMSVLGDKSHPQYVFIKDCRTLGKKTNFTTEYGAKAPKLAQTLMVSEQDAAIFIDAKEATFPEASLWKESVVAEAKQLGYVKSKLGAVRHLGKLLSSEDRFEASKAERQAVNYKIQGSSAEMTKLAEGRIFKARLEQLYDCQIIAAIHDEVIASVAISDLEKFLPAMHACMVEQYADMFIPVGSSISFGPDLSRQCEIGETPSIEAIAKGLEALEKLVQQKETA